MKSTCALLNNKRGGGCVNILTSFEWRRGGEAEEVVLSTSSSERHLSFYSQLTRNMLFSFLGGSTSYLPGSRSGRQTAAGCRWCLRRCGRFSDLSSLAPLRRPAGQRHRKFTSNTAPCWMKGCRTRRCQRSCSATFPPCGMMKRCSFSISLPPFLPSSFPPFLPSRGRHPAVHVSQRAGETAASGERRRGRRPAHVTFSQRPCGLHAFLVALRCVHLRHRVPSAEVAERCATSASPCRGARLHRLLDLEPSGGV